MAKQTEEEREERLVLARRKINDDLTHEIEKAHEAKHAKIAQVQKEYRDALRAVDEEFIDAKQQLRAEADRQIEALG